MVPSIQAQICAMNARRTSRSEDMEENLRAIVEFLEGRQADRIDIQRHIGCSAATAARYTDLLVAQGRVVESAVGRLLVYRLNPKEAERLCRMGVDE